MLHTFKQTIVKSLGIGTLFAGLSIGTNHSAQSCVFVDYKNTYIFGINLLSSSPFLNYYYNSPYSEDYCFPGNEQNIIEWQKIYPEVKNLDAFHEIVYRADSETLVALLNGIATKNNPLPNNEFAKVLLSKNDKEMLDYLLFAKDCEPLVVQQYGWEETTKQEINSGKAKNLITDGLTKYKNTSNTFIKQRLAFQVIRLAYYQMSPQDCLAYFDELAAQSTKNYIYYRTLLHKGFALKKQQKKAEANIVFAEVFANENSLSCLAFKNMAFYKTDIYSGFDESIWQETLNKAPNEQVKSALMMLRAATQRGLEPSILDSALENGAELAQMEVMLLKQLKEAETTTFLPYLEQTVALDSTKLTYGEWNATDTVTGITNKGFFQRIWDSILNFFKSLFGGKQSSSATPQKPPTVLYAQMTTNKIEIANDYNIKQLETVSLKIAEKHKSAVFYLGAAYLQVMRQAYGLVEDNLELARQHAKNNNDVLQQASYLHLLKTVLQADKITAEVENEVVQSLEKLWKNPKTDNNGWQRLLAMSEMARKYMTQGDLHKAVLTFNYTKQTDVAGMLMDFYMTHGDLEGLLTYLNNEPNSPWETILVKSLGQNTEQRIHFIKDVQATKLAREGKFVEAVAIFKEIPATYWKGNPTTATTNNTPTDTPPTSPDKVVLGGGSATILLGVSEETLESGNFVYSFADDCPQIRTSFSHTPLETPTLAKMSKVEIVEKLAELAQKASNATGDDQAKLYMEMANAMYYSPFWIYNAAIWQCGGFLDALRSCQPNGYPFNINTEFATALHNRKMSVVNAYCIPTLAAVYYQKASSVAKDKELAAKALYCQGAALQRTLASHWEEGIKLDYRTPLQKLVKEFGDTKAAQEAMVVCPSLSMYK